MKSDVELLQAWRGGDREAGDAFFGRHFDAIFDFFDRKTSDDVSDLVQRTFLGCVEGLPRFRGDASPRTFLYAIARNELYQHFRRRKRNDALDFGVSSLRDLGPSPSSALALRDDLTRLVEGLETLPLDLQILVELRFWEGLKRRELAVVLDVPEGTVASRLTRAIRLLRTHMVERTSAPADHLGDDESFAAWAQSVRPFDPASALEAAPSG